MRSDFSILCRELLREDVHVRMHVSGTSMHPTLREGDVVELRPVSADRPKRGDLVLFESARGLTLHRVIGRSGHQLITRGDASTSEDHPVQRDEVLGIVVSRTRDDRRVQLNRSRLLLSFFRSQILILGLALRRRLISPASRRLRRSPAA